MDTQAITAQRLSASVIAVPPLARSADLKLDIQQNRRMVQHLEAGGVSTLLYGGNAVLIHLRDFSCGGFTSGCVCIAPRLSMQLMHAVQAGDFDRAETGPILPLLSPVDPGDRAEIERAARKLLQDDGEVA